MYGDPIDRSLNPSNGPRMPDVPRLQKQKTSLRDQKGTGTHVRRARRPEAPKAQKLRFGTKKDHPADAENQKKKLT